VDVSDDVVDFKIVIVASNVLVETSEPILVICIVVIRGSTVVVKLSGNVVS
jgi:hypothetical protein